MLHRSKLTINQFHLQLSISPNNNPITSNLIDVKKPKITKPTARDECANKPNKASFGSFVFFCNFKRMIAKTA